MPESSKLPNINLQELVRTRTLKMLNLKIEMDFPCHMSARYFKAWIVTLELTIPTSNLWCFFFVSCLFLQLSNQLQPQINANIFFVVFILTSALSVSSLPADIEKGRRKVVHVLGEDILITAHLESALVLPFTDLMVLRYYSKKLHNFNHLCWITWSVQY